MDKRVEILRGYELLDTLPESEFDDIVELASAFFGMPISLISLLDSHRQWFKAKVGLDATETPIEYAFCYHAIQRPEEVFVVPDSFKDDRFHTNPLATGVPHVRFYAGAPLVTNEGYALGTLCVIDNQPRQFSPEQQRVLKILAAKVIERFESRRDGILSKRAIAATNAKLGLALNRLLEAEKIAGIGNWSIDYTDGEVYWSPEMYRLHGIPEGEMVSIPFWRSMMYAEDTEMLREARRALIPDGPAVTREVRIRRPDGAEKWLLLTIESSYDNHIIGTALDVTARKKAEASKAEYTSALEQMLFALSHKVRKPVANMLGIADMLKIENISTSDIRESMSHLNIAAEELDGYIHELNDFIAKHKDHLNKPAGQF